MSGFAIDVVLRTHNRADMLEAAVESLFAADRTGIALRLLLVDNASSDETPRLVARLAERHAPLLVPLREEKPGGQHALNCAIAHASAPVIATPYSRLLSCAAPNNARTLATTTTTPVESTKAPSKPIER